MEIREELVSWFQKNHRKLSFRENKDPYAIWVSEIMAQQTRIDTMLGYYERWMESYPSIQALAEAPIEAVLKSWEGLGYYNRARKLHEGAKQVMNEYNGELPHTAVELEKIAGIGPYTAGAIASIAFSQRAPAVDGNVLRVVSRLLMLEDDVAKQATHKKVKQIVYEWMNEENASDFTEGLMELGAMVCMPQVILCEQCPLNHVCLAYKANRQSAFPIKSKAKKPLEIHYNTLLIIQENQILMSQDDTDGLMKGFWRLPQRSKVDERQLTYIGKQKHVYSHRVWQMEIWQGSDFDANEYESWIRLDQLETLAIIGAHRKILDTMLK